MAIDAYAQAAKLAGCPKDQLSRFVNAGVVLQPRQLRASALARSCDDPTGPDEVGYGGARGGGKSHWAMAQVGIDDCQRQPDLKCLMLRRIGKAGKENFEDIRARLFSSLPHKYNSSRGILEFPNGSRIVLGHFNKESDVDTYLGLEYDVIVVEEATTLSESKVKNIKTCLRTSKPNWRPRMYMTTNPGGVGHRWFKKRFIKPGEPGCQFVKATVDDNRFINPEYKKNTLDKLTGWQLRAWRDGDWDIESGTFFEFSEDVHVRSEIDTTGFVKFWLGFDYGYTHFTSCHLFGKDGDGNVLVIDEHADRKRLPEFHAQRIKAMLERNGLSVEQLKGIHAGRDCFAKRADEHGLTIAQQYEGHGLKFTPADDDRINGAAEFTKRLGCQDPENESYPTLFIHQRCRRLIECMSALIHDPNRPEDVLKIDVDEDGEGGDDAYDSARYGLMADKRPIDFVMF